ncbi:N-acetyltransferase [Actinoplanes philippinensis]|uniref:Acetyltransferase (GNAT) domain-containing protein n=1 Tax=Actinoplanes philippinensis TaxID=35752 RepID=A0A1I2HDW5_9ACTN|nr:GNAT family N-acetyltransferase [Actinoplanes philippinensis]GIE81737.1 N-acetyltransferase [Actinoplanes philippinensis]SFF28374.1 Acetyltransferase (GNAT) domain-containing protein [Actinoplanes philippinensis]
MFTITAATAEELREQVNRLHTVYRQCFAAPPWNETPEDIAAYPRQLDRQTSYPGAHGFIAEHDGQIAGAVYGWPAPPRLPENNEYDLAVRDAAGPDVADLLVAPAVIVAELMVAPAHRRRGLGRTLLARYVAGHPRAWLATHPQAPAVALYETEGWIRRAAYLVGRKPLVLYTREATTARHIVAGGGMFATPLPPDRRPRSRPY